MKLTEIHHITAERLAEIQQWITKFGIGKPNFNIHPDTGIVDVYQSVIIENHEFSHLPIRFGVLAGCFTIKSCPHLVSLEGCPPIIDHTFNCINNPGLHSAIGGPQLVKDKANYKNCFISTFEGFPKEIIGDLSIKDLQITNFSGISKHIKAILGCIDVGHGGERLTGGLVGVLRIKNLQFIKAEWLGKELPQKHAIDIINRHLQGDRYITECQQELEDAGLEVFASI